jgi:hypothetical protein
MTSEVAGRTLPPRETSRISQGAEAIAQDLGGLRSGRFRAQQSNSPKILVPSLRRWPGRETGQSFFARWGLELSLIRLNCYIPLTQRCERL